jgi:hypothetical protein
VRLFQVTFEKKRLFKRDESRVLGLAMSGNRDEEGVWKKRKKKVLQSLTGRHQPDAHTRSPHELLVRQPPDKIHWLGRLLQLLLFLQRTQRLPILKVVLVCMMQHPTSIGPGEHRCERPDSLTSHHPQPREWVSSKHCDFGTYELVAQADCVLALATVG